MDVFSKKKLGIRLYYGVKDDATTLDPTKASTFRGLPITVDLTVGHERNDAQVVVYGLPREVMIHSVTYASNPRPSAWSPNVIEIFSYEEDFGVISETVLFVGNILSALSDFNAQPAVPTTFIAEYKYSLKMTSVAVSLEGDRTVEEIMNYLCAKVNMEFLCDSERIKSKVLTDFASKMDFWTIIRDVAQQARALLFVRNGVVLFDDVDESTYQKEKFLSVVAEVSRVTGMIGYPRYIEDCFQVEVLFSPNINCADRVLLNVPEIGIDNTVCRVLNVTHTLSTETIGSQWKSSFLMQQEEWG